MARADHPPAKQSQQGSCADGQFLLLRRRLLRLIGGEPCHDFRCRRGMHRCKYTDCVDVCPVDAFREGPDFLVIDPAECIDCAVCVPECPVNAIYAEEDVPSHQQHFTALNAELSRGWKPITRTKLALPDAQEWAKVEAKLGELKR